MKSLHIIIGSLFLALSNTATANWTGVYVGTYAGAGTGSRVTTSEPFRLDNGAYWFRPFSQSITY